MFVETRGLTKGYSGVPALKEVSLAAREGEVIAFVGFNGAGKTTLLRCIAGQVAPDRGNVAFDGVSFARDQLAVVLLTIALAGTMPFSFWTKGGSRATACSCHDPPVGELQSERDCVLQPRVARNEPPWGRPTK